MYRVLEHAMDDFHSRRSQDTGPFRPSELFGQDAPPQSVVLDKVMSMHAQLPLRFKETRNVLSEAEDRFSFQAANIAATLQVRSSSLLVYDLQLSHSVHVACTHGSIHGRRCYC